MYNRGEKMSYDDDKIRIKAKIQRSKLMDDEFFRACMRNNIPAAQCILRVVLDDDKLVVESMKTQEDIKNLFGKSSWFDIHAIDNSGRHLDVEIQNASEGASKRRARYYSSLLDANISKSGESYDDIPDNLMIMITEKDELKGGFPLYHINRYVRETGVFFEDGSHIIYVNGQYKGDDPVGRLMQDFHEIDASKMHYPELRDTVAHFKNTEEGEEQMSDEFQEWLDEREAKGELKKQMEIASNLIKLGKLSLADIADSSGLDFEDVEKLAEKIKSEIKI